MKEGSQKVGKAAEDSAAAYLTRQGLTIVAQNYACRFGEIDLIAKDGKTLVFVEVRYRKTPDFGGARESITAHKQQKIARAAAYFLQTYGKTPICRFDCVLIADLDNEQAIEWEKDAFSL